MRIKCSIYRYFSLSNMLAVSSSIRAFVISLWYDLRIYYWRSSGISKYRCFSIDISWCFWFSIRIKFFFSDSFYNLNVVISLSYLSSTKVNSLLRASFSLSFASSSFVNATEVKFLDEAIISLSFLSRSFSIKVLLSPKVLLYEGLGKEYLLLYLLTSEAYSLWLLF